MNRIATATVIRGNGECVAFINGVVSEEMKRQQAQMRAERERARMVEESRDDLRNDRRIAFRLYMAKRHRSPFARLCDRLADLYALVMGTLIVWGLQLGLLEEVRDGEQL